MNHKINILAFDIIKSIPHGIKSFKKNKSLNIFKLNNYELKFIEKISPHVH